MMNSMLKEKLKKNWGDQADCLECLAYVRVYDPLSPWECYIYAMNPQDEDEISCLVKGFFVETTKRRLSEITSYFNAEGEPPQVDLEYRPRRVADILKKLIEQGNYESTRS